MLKGVKEFIAEAEAYERPPTFVMEEVPHEEAKNCYHARYRLQKHYNDAGYLTRVCPQAGCALRFARALVDNNKKACIEEQRRSGISREIRYRPKA